MLFMLRILFNYSNVKRLLDRSICTYLWNYKVYHSAKKCEHLNNDSHKNQHSQMKNRQRDVNTYK